MIVFISILVDVLLTILHSVNAITIGVATILDFNIFGLFFTIICMGFGGRHFCRCVNTITLLRKYLKG